MNTLRPAAPSSEGAGFAAVLCRLTCPSRSPKRTWAPTAADVCRMPACGAGIWVSIFIASSTTTGSSAATVAPSSTSHRTTVPVMIETIVSGSADGSSAVSVPPLTESAALAPPAKLPAATPAAKADGNPSSTRLPSSSIHMRVIGRPSPPRCSAPSPVSVDGSMRGRNDSSIHRVYTPRWSGEAKSGSASTALSNGMTVGTPTIRSSASARRARRRHASRSGA